MTTVVELYASLVDAQQAITELIDGGFDRQRISFVMATARVVNSAAGVSAGVVVDDGNDRSIKCASGERRGVLVAGPLATSGRMRPLFGSEWSIAEAIQDAGLARFAVIELVDAICAGAILVAINCDDCHAQTARDILGIGSLSHILGVTRAGKLHAFTANTATAV